MCSNLIVPFFPSNSMPCSGYSALYGVNTNLKKCFLLNKTIMFNKKQVRIENRKSHTGFWSDEPCASAHIRITN